MLIQQIAVSALSLAFFCFEIWAVSVSPRLKDLPWYLLFGAAIGAALGVIL